MEKEMSVIGVFEDKDDSTLIYQNLQAKYVTE